MPNIERKLNNIKTIQKGKIPKEYRFAGGPKKYQTEYEKYNAVYKEIDECCEQELDILEILLKSEIESAKSLNNYKGIFSLTVSIFVCIFTVSTQLISPVLSSIINMGESLEVALPFISKIYYLISALFIIIILSYWSIDSRSSRKIQRGQYLLYVLTSVKKKRDMA